MLEHEGLFGSALPEAGELTPQQAVPGACKKCYTAFSLYYS
jgi:hypothetical protein